ncbi:hypothetical protein [Muricoccus radiodurans]
MILNPFRLPLLAMHGAAILATHIAAGAALAAAGTVIAVAAARRANDRS